MTAASTLLTPLEVAAGIVLRHEVASQPLPDPPPGDTPRAALERAILPALQAPPCLVSFSGGRDSSAVLAVAAGLARREGLAAPVPATNRFGAAADSHEADWQEQVVRHLGLEDWIRIELETELDVVGPVAREVLRRHGILWPCNAHFHVPLLRHAAGGTLLTGIGGDEVFGAARYARVHAVLGGRARPRPRDVLRIGVALSPRPLRRRALGRHPLPELPWLRPDAQREVRRALLAEASTEPLRWRGRFRWLAVLPYLRVGTASLDLLAGDAGARILHPLRDHGFLAALGALPRGSRFAGRTDGMRRLFGDALPAAIVERTTKAGFDEAFWNEPSRSLAARWEGEGVDASLVDPEKLREEWSSEAPDPRSFTLLQSVWLARESGRDELEQALGRAGE